MEKSRLLQKHASRCILDRELALSIMMLISPEDYKGLLETINTLSDKPTTRRIRKSWEEVRAGKTVTLEALRKHIEGAS